MLLKAGEVIFVIATLIFLLAFKLHTHEGKPAPLNNNEKILQHSATVPSSEIPSVNNSIGSINYRNEVKK